MRFLVSVNQEGVQSTLGPYDNLDTAEAMVARLACGIVTRDPFRAYVIPVPDYAGPPEQAASGLDG